MVLFFAASTISLQIILLASNAAQGNDGAKTGILYFFSQAGNPFCYRYFGNQL